MQLLFHSNHFISITIRKIISAYKMSPAIYTFVVSSFSPSVSIPFAITPVYPLVREKTEG